MDGFSYSDIFATKGFEYLVIISFLTLLVPFWLILNKQVKAGNKVKKALGFLSASILRIPQGLFFSENHTWMYMEKSGAAKVGLDDLLLHITGEVKFNPIRHTGETIRKGDLLTEMTQDGKLLQIFSPVSGKVLETNLLLNEPDVLLNEDPYGKGWIFKIKPSKWMEETRLCFFAEEATLWSASEVDRFRDFLAMAIRNHSPKPSMVILQDGGEICDHSLSVLPNEIWKDFQKDFLTPNHLPTTKV